MAIRPRSPGHFRRDEPQRLRRPHPGMRGNAFDEARVKFGGASTEIEYEVPFVSGLPCGERNGDERETRMDFAKPSAHEVPKDPEVWAT